MKYGKHLIAIVAVLALFSFSPPPAAAGGGDEGVDITPFAAIDVEGPMTAITVDGLNFEMVDDASVSDAIGRASVTAVVQIDDDLSFTTVGSEGGLSTVLAATLLAMPAPTLASMGSAPSSVDTHPKPPRDEYNLKKTIITSGGKEKEIFKTLIVEKRAGESGSEFQRRSEKELREAMDAGWESVS